MNAMPPIAPTVGTHSFFVTTFTDHAAASKTEASWTLPALAARIQATNGPSKASLPWLKLARFGDDRTAKGSFRHDKNVLAITGIEADYDGGQMPVAEAVERLEKAGIMGTVYTSPSHSEDAPRWRVICPTSRELPPEQRSKLMGRLNGLFGGIFSVETWTLSQAYYFGSVAGSPSHEVHVIDGTPIDDHHELDEIWIGKPGTPATGAPQQDVAGDARTDAELIQRITTGEGYHRELCSLAARYIGRGEAEKSVVERLRAIMNAKPEAERDVRWGHRFGQIPKLVSTAAEKFGAPANGGVWPTPNMIAATAEPLPAPVLPLHDVFPPRWADWIKKAAASKCAPVDYVAAALLAGAGALIGNSRWSAPTDSWGEPPALDVALVGLPSAGKSPAMDAVVDLLTAIEADANTDWSQRKRDHERDKAAAGERKTAWLATVKAAVSKAKPTDGRDHGPVNCNDPASMPENAEEPDAPVKRRVLSTDPTVAKAERLSAANPRGLIQVRDELAGWITGMDRYSGGGDRQFWLQTYGGRHWAPDRVKDGDREVSVPHLTWGIVGGIQPDRLASLMLSGADDGFTARFLYFWPNPPPFMPLPENGARPAAGVWLKRLVELPWAPPAPILVPFTTRARAALDEWRRQVAGMEAEASGLFLSWVGKLPGFAVRLALIFAHLAWCADGAGDAPAEVAEWDLLRAMTLLENYAVPMARRAFGEAALPVVERDSRTLARWLMRQSPIPEVVNGRTLRRMNGGPSIPDSGRMEAALGDLAALGWVREAPPSNSGIGGRARGDWLVNPKLREAPDGGR